MSHGTGTPDPTTDSTGDPLPWTLASELTEGVMGMEPGTVSGSDGGARPSSHPEGFSENGKTKGFTGYLENLSLDNS